MYSETCCTMAYTWKVGVISDVRYFTVSCVEKRSTAYFSSPLSFSSSPSRSCGVACSGVGRPHVADEVLQAGHDRSDVRRKVSNTPPCAVCA